MPKIPQGTAQTFNLPTISPERLGAPWGAVERAGERIEGLGEYGAKVYDALAELENKAIRETKAMEIGQSLDNDFGILKEELATSDVNFEKWEPEFKQKAQKLKEKYQDQLNVNDNPDRILSQMYEKLFNHHFSNFSNDIRKKKLTVITERGQSAFLNEMNNDLANYVMEPDETKKKLIRTNFEIKANSLIGSLFTAEQVNSFTKSWDANALKVQKDKIEEAKGMVRQKMILDPIQTEIDLLSGKHDRELITQDAKADMLEKAATASKIQLAEDDKKLKEQDKFQAEREEEDIQISMRKENFTRAYILADSAKFMDARKKKYWTDAIDQKTKEKKEEVDPVVEAAEIVRINDMISRQTMPTSAIRNHIITTPNLKAPNREQYINKLETKLNAEIKDGRDDGYKEIVNVIFPQVRGLPTLPMEKLIQTPQQTYAIMKAQIALDDWINNQIKAEKYPTRKEIRLRAFDLAVEYQPSISDRLDFIKEKAKKAAEEALKKK